jgi:hypothetical protein
MAVLSLWCMISREDQQTCDRLLDPAGAPRGWDARSCSARCRQAKRRALPVELDGSAVQALLAEADIAPG